MTVQNNLSFVSHFGNQVATQVSKLEIIQGSISSDSEHTVIKELKFLNFCV